MASTLRARSRAAAVVVTTVVLTALVAGPAAALPGRDLTFDDGEQRGTTMSIGTAFLVFVGIPLVVTALVWLLVKAPAWKSSSQPDDLRDGEALPVSSADRPGLVAGGQAPLDPDAAEAFVPASDDMNVDVDTRDR